MQYKEATDKKQLGQRVSSEAFNQLNYLQRKFTNDFGMRVSKDYVLEVAINELYMKNHDVTNPIHFKKDKKDNSNISDSKQSLDDFIISNIDSFKNQGINLHESDYKKIVKVLKDIYEEVNQ